MKPKAVQQLLLHLTELYYEDSGGKAYQQALAKAQLDIFYTLPCMTVAFAEIREPGHVPSMAHVLVAEPTNTEHALGWNDNITAILSLDNGKTALWDVAYLEVKQGDTWKGGNVVTVANGFALALEGGEILRLRFGDTVRKVLLRREEAPL